MMRGREKNNVRRKRQRSCSEKGHVRRLGNGKRGFCRYCKPTLANRLDRREHIQNEIKYYQNDYESDSQNESDDY